MVTHATITGRITIPQSDVGIAARVYATPETSGRVLTVDDRLTIGPVSADTDTAGNLPASGPEALRVPTDHGIDGLIWTITAKPLNNASIKHEVLLGRYEITTNGALQNLLQIDQTLVKATAVASLQALVETVETEVAGKVAQAETARTGAQIARTGAEVARDEAEAARDTATGIALGDAQAALQGYLESNDLPPDGTALAAQQAAAVAAALSGDQITDASVLERLTFIGLSDAARSAAAARSAWEDNDGFSENWLDLSDWTHTTTVSVSGGKLFYTGSGSNPVAKRALADFSGQVRAIGAIQVVDGTSANKSVLIGLTKGTAGDLSDALGSNFLGIGTHPDGRPMGFQNGGYSSLTALDGHAAANPLPAGTYYVTVVLTASEVSLVMHNADMSIYARRSTSRAGYGGMPTGVLIFNADSRATAGNAALPIGGRVGYVSEKPRGNAETVARVARYAVAPRHTRWSTILTPAAYDSRKPCPVVIYCHGSSDDDEDILPATRPTAIGPVGKALVDSGFIVASSDFGGPTNWGNLESTATMLELYRHLRDAYPLGPIGIIGHSMGGLVSLTTIANRAVPGIAAWYGIEPVCSLAAAYQGGYTAPIKAAHGIASDGSDYATKTAGRDPMLRAGWEFRGLPMKFVASPSDTAVPKALHTDLLAAKVEPYAASVAVTTASGPHVDPSHFNPADAVAFFNGFLRA